jgi:hypothetical protein
MAVIYEFSIKEIEKAFDSAATAWEGCSKALSWSRASSGRGQWEAHYRDCSTPFILDTGGFENSRFNCGPNGLWSNPGITPRFYPG